MVGQLLSQLAAGIMSKPKKLPRRTFRQVLIDFYYTSTAHGICHAANARSRKIRIFWILVFIICFIVMIVQLSFIVRKYLQYQIIVEVDIRYEHANFPAVTVCNLNPFKNSLTEETEGVSQTLKMLTTKLAEKSSASELRKRSKRDGSKVPRDVRANLRLDSPKENEEVLAERFIPVLAECVCDSRHPQRSCIPWSGEKEFAYPRHFKPSKCTCDYDVSYESPWPCYPTREWEMKLCINCDTYGHCPKRFWREHQDVGLVHHCMCHHSFGQCTMKESTSNVPHLSDLGKVEDLPGSIDTGTNSSSSNPTMPSTTLQPEIIEALGYEESLDELATKAQGQENLVFAVASMTSEGKKSLSYTRDELILKCSFNGLDCHKDRDFKLHIDPVYGNCYTFNHNESRLPPLRTSRAGATYGLRVLMYSNTSDYLPTTEAIGVRVNVHSPSVTPFPDAFGYSAPVGTLTSFGIRQGCYRSCFQNELIRECSCGDPRYPVPSGSETCSTTNATARQCLKNSTRETDSSSSKGILCDCKQPCSCREHAFEVTVSSSSWPSAATQVMDCVRGDEMCLDHYRRNAAMVQVYFEQLNFEAMEEVPVYLFANLLSDMGGQLGLWLGLSVVSGLEFIMLVLDLSQTWYLDKKEEEKHVEREDTSSSFNPPGAINCVCDCDPGSKCDNIHIDGDEEGLIIPPSRKITRSSFNDEPIREILPNGRVRTPEHQF